MSADGSVVIAWPDQERRFRLGLGEIRELEERRNLGGMEIFQRFAEQRFRVDDLRETIRLGLIGGGLSAPQALALINRYVVPGAFGICVPIAQAIIGGAYFGSVEDDIPKAPTEEASTGAPDASLSPKSTAAAQSLDGRRAPLTN